MKGDDCGDGQGNDLDKIEINNVNVHISRTESLRSGSSMKTVGSRAGISQSAEVKEAEPQRNHYSLRSFLAQQMPSSIK